MRIARESWIIAAIGTADLVTTIIFIKHHGAQEANPLFRLYWEMGIMAFIAAKMACLLGPLFVLEWARKRNPRFVSRALRGAIAAYLAFYGIGFLKLNSPAAHADEIRQEVAVYHSSRPVVTPYMQMALDFASVRGHLPNPMSWMNGYGMMPGFYGPMMGMYPMGVYGPMMMRHKGLEIGFDSSYAAMAARMERRVLHDRFQKAD